MCVGGVGVSVGKTGSCSASSGGGSGVGSGSGDDMGTGVGDAVGVAVVSGGGSASGSSGLSAVGGGNSAGPAGLTAAGGVGVADVLRSRRSVEPATSPASGVGVEALGADWPAPAAGELDPGVAGAGDGLLDGGGREVPGSAAAPCSMAARSLEGASDRTGIAAEATAPAATTSAGVSAAASAP